MLCTVLARSATTSHRDLHQDNQHKTNVSHQATLQLHMTQPQTHFPAKRSHVCEQGPLKDTLPHCSFVASADRGGITIAWELMDPPVNWCPLPTKAAWEQEREARYREPEKLKQERLRQQNQRRMANKAHSFARRVGYFAVHYKLCLLVGISKLDMASL